jgi:ATP-dependent Clp protease adaptor protein ClpS
MTQTLPAPTEVLDAEDFTLTEDLWAVLVWNDDVNTFDHVITALVEILRHSPARAEQLAWKVHNEGRAVVALRPHEEAVAAVEALLSRKIQASLDRA